jgi:ATP-dependent exoDNAse (exonuclease V) beta subunit
MTVVEVVAVAGAADAPEVELPVGAGRIRGLLLHKLMEEVLTGEVQDDLNHLTQRARTLANELPVDQADARTAPDPQEVAATIRRTLNLSEIAALRPRLIPEFPVQASLSLASGPVAVTGRADAVEFVEGRPRVIVDWKSDVAPTEQDTREHANQLEYYLSALDAQRGLLVYMTSGVVRSVDGSGTGRAHTGIATGS